MKDMDVAVDRLQQAIDKNEIIMVFGDYDVDSAVALLAHYLQRKKLEVISYIPDRYAEGYGLSHRASTRLSRNALSCYSLWIAESVDLIEYANQGIDVIVCDHHNPGEQLPDAHAVLDPKRSVQLPI